MSIKMKDWGPLGQLLATVVRLYSVTTKVFKEMSIGPEILDWLDGPGRDCYSKKLKEIAEECKLQTTPILQTVINLDADPSLPSIIGITKKKHIGGGKKVLIEKRLNNGVYLNGKKLTLHQSERQINGKTILGHELLLEVENLPVQNATLCDFFMAHPEFVPDDWKEDEKGNPIYIYFWGTLFLNPDDGCIFVRSGLWAGDHWISDHRWLGNHFYYCGRTVVSEGDRAA